MLVDTDVLVWYMRGNEQAYRAVEEAKNFSLSVVTYIELVQGMRNKDELNRLRKSLRRWEARILYVSEEISAKAMFLVEQHYLSHSLRLADALIGATAITCGSPLFTANDRHYKVIKGIEIRIFRP